MNAFLTAIGPVASVPIKPISQITRLLPTTPHPNARTPTPRNAYALAASAVANGLQLVTDVEIPRSFVFSGVKAVIENGVARDILKAELASLVSANDPAEERFQLSERQVRQVRGLIGTKVLEERGL